MKMKEKLKVLMSEFNYINYTYEKKCGKITVKKSYLMFERSAKEIVYEQRKARICRKRNQPTPYRQKN